MSSRTRSWSFLETSVQESFFWSLTLSVLPVVSAFAISWFVARWAGAEVWGTVSWAMAFATAALIVGKFGLELGASRLASEYGVNRPGALRPLIHTAVGLRLVFTVPIAAATFLFAGPVAGWFNDSSLVGPVRMASGVIVCASVYEFCEHFLIGLNRHATVSRVRSVMLLSRVALTVAIVLAGLGATYILGGYCAAWVVAIAAFGVMLIRYLPPAGGAVGTEVPRNATRRLMALSIPLAVSSASVTVYSQMDKLMLGYFNGVEEVGQYAVARAVTEVSLFPAFALVMMLRPALASRYASGDLSQCADLIKNSLRVSLVFGVLFAAVYAVFAEPLMVLIYSEKFRYAGSLMSVFLLVLVLRSLGAMVLPALVAAERTKTYAYLTAISAVTNFGLNLLLIPRYDAWGAVVATIISYGVLLIAGLRQTFRIFGVRLGTGWFLDAIRTVLAGGVAGVLCWQVSERIRPDGPPGSASSDVWVLLWAVILTGVYAALLMLMKVVSIDDIRTSFTNLRNRK
ncbi:MAG: oligosaccharide flippase family protein [Candidatus Latescibacterota bacterium]|jgi:O-antigen/teichoic acid export membrane protein